MDEQSVVVNKGNDSTVTESTEAQETNTAGGDLGEKKFTQADVDRIIKERLLRNKASKEKDAADEYNEKLAELKKRETGLACREYLAANHYPAELLEVIDTSDLETFKTKADKACSVFYAMQPKAQVAPLFNPSENLGKPDLQTAFKNTKHSPKQYPPRYDD